MVYFCKTGVILDHFPVHLPQRNLINDSWRKYRLKLLCGMFTNHFLSNMQPLNYIKEYYGEKFGFYFSWLIHYTGWLIPAAIVGSALGIAIIDEAKKDDKPFEQYLASPLSIIYGIFIMLWITFLHESWKRK